MIFVEGVMVFSDVYSILKKLQHELHTLGISLLAEIKPPKDNQDIVLTCPYHKHGQEHKPAGCVATIQKRHVDAGTFYCFSCKKTATLQEMISHCFGKHDGGAFGKQWLCDNFSVSGDRSKAFNVPKREQTVKLVGKVEQSELESYRWIHPYLYKRGMTDELIEMFDLGYDKVTQTVTFPIKDINGNVLFVAKRSVNTKRFYLPKDLDKPLCYLYEAKKYYPDSKELYICESLLNSLTCFKFNLPCVALLGTGSASQLKALQNLGYRKYVICLDNDEAGQIGRKKLKKALDNFAFLEYNIPPKGKDINDFAFCKNREEFLKKSS